MGSSINTTPIKAVTAYARHVECHLITDKQTIPMDW